MNWEAVSASAEIIGMIAVIISIIYLAVQVRLSRVWSRKQAFESYLALLFGWTAKVSSDSDTARLYVAGRKSFEELSEEDQMRFAHLLLEKFACLELLREYDKDQLGKLETVDKAIDWIREELTQPGSIQWWNERGSKAMSSDFATYVNGLISTDRNRSKP